MADWKEQYLTALDARDDVEKANLDLYNYCMIASHSSKVC